MTFATTTPQILAKVGAFESDEYFPPKYHNPCALLTSLLEVRKIAQPQWKRNIR